MDLWKRARTSVETGGRLVQLGGEATFLAVTDIVRGRFSWSEFFLQAWFMVRVSLLPTILVAIPFGVITSVQIGAVASQIGAGSFSGAVNGIGVLRQGAPLVTSLMIAGAVGSAICSDLGARTVREEIDAMKVMGINPVQRLVSPRVVAALIVALLLTVIVAIVALTTAMILNVSNGSISVGTYLSSFVSFSSPMDLFMAELKALIFGFIAGVVAAHRGLNPRPGPKGVGEAVNQSVVISFLLLFFVNLILTAIYLKIVPPKG